MGHNGGRAFANKNCPQGRAFDQFFQMLGVFPGVYGGGGMLAAGIDSHIIFNCSLILHFVLSKLILNAFKSGIFVSNSH